MSKVTAKDMYFKVKDYRENLISGLDDWIDGYLFDSFKDRGASVSINDSVVAKQGWSMTLFIESMNDRGFYVEYQCEDLPCGNCFYTITIPPQEE
ncbi:hypothetical protein D3C85_517050 [compost metagenome]